MAQFCPAIKIDSVSVIRFPFLSHVPVICCGFPYKLLKQLYATNSGNIVQLIDANKDSMNLNRLFYSNEFIYIYPNHQHELAATQGQCLNEV